MAIIAVGNEATIKSPTLEGQILETLVFIKLMELFPGKNPNNKNSVSGNYNVANSSFSGSFTIPIVPTVNPNGSTSYTGENYFANVTFTSGMGGTFKSNDPISYLLELITYAQILEADTTKNPTQADNISSNIDGNSRTCTGDVDLPIIISISANGQQQIVAKEYLVS